MFWELNGPEAAYGKALATFRDLRRKLAEAETSIGCKTIWFGDICGNFLGTLLLTEASLSFDTGTASDFESGTIMLTTAIFSLGT